jgi:hypothetical protein
MKTKTKIIKSFLENREAKTIKEISKVIKADYRITHMAAQRLLEENVLVSTRVGPAHLCQMNPNYYGSEIFLAEEERKQNLFQNQNIKQLYYDLMKKLNGTLFIMIFLKKPGINLLFISNEANFKKKVDEGLSMIPLQINTSVLTTEEFKKMSPQNNIVLHNVESYYLLKK